MQVSHINKNSLALFLLVNLLYAIYKKYLNHTLGLTLSTPV